ncbi:hypothetical protein Moror_16835 [Moniliophthora roreri MCA 2997]|uniref:Transmembrane protein n=2 Tax=Moniliophthora roreri TaxID=221103 RepID=V2WSE9_MONRO|nr:hypothetical protein Moror_16835 [Moniliophthora roreri MCA 2997]
MHLLGSSLLSYCISRRIPPWSLSTWKHLTWGRTCILLVLLDSWIFVFFSGILSLGVNIDGSLSTCSLAILLCICFYGSSKMLIYAFLVEKVYIVWSAGNQTPRLKTTVYQICLTVQLGYIAVILMMILGRSSMMNRDGVCVLGLRSFSTISLATYELTQNVFFTAMFLWPFWRSHPMSPRLKIVAKRTLIAACGSLTVSAMNILVMIGLQGSEIGWICLTNCVIDVTINALLLFWVSASTTTGNVNWECRDRFSLPRMDLSALTVTVPEPAAACGHRKERDTVGSWTLNGNEFPEEYFDYIPREHLRSPDVEEAPTPTMKEREDNLLISPTQGKQ